jgi:hypothetical protein
MLLVIVIFCAFSCSNAEKDFEKAKTANTIKDYEDYIQKHPNSELVKEAKKAIYELTLIANKLKAENDFKKAKTANNIKDYEDYIQKHPDSERVKEARKAIYDLAVNEDRLKKEIENHVKIQENDATIRFKSFSISEPNFEKYTINFYGKYKSMFSLGGKVSGIYNYKKEHAENISFSRYSVFSKDLEIDGIAYSSSGEPLRNTKLKFRPDKSDKLGTVVGQERPSFEVTTDKNGNFHCEGVPFGSWFVSANVKQSDGTLKTVNLGKVQTGAFNRKLAPKK